MRVAPQSRNAADTRRILCVEDDDPTRAVIAAALKDLSPAFAADGYEAVVNYSGATFDAFVVDVRLPDCNGISLCRDIRRLDPHVPVVLWTVADASDLR